MGGASTKLSPTERCARHKSHKPCWKEEGCVWDFKSTYSNVRVCQAYVDIHGRAIYDAIYDNKWE